MASTVTLLSSPSSDFIFMGSSLISLPSKLLGFFPSLLTFFSVGALGGSFAYAFYETDTIFTSMTMHFIHNTILVILSLFIL